MGDGGESDAEEVQVQKRKTKADTGHKEAVEKKKTKKKKYLSDKTKFAKKPWSELKESAMKDDYKEQEWFQGLKKKEVKMLIAIIEAQKAQGDMAELKEVEYKKKKKSR